jgi:predicted nuclease with TOPRIM domain
MMLDLDEIKSRINPAYADRRGSESNERKMLCNEIERLRAESEALRSDVAKWVTDYQAQKMRNDRLEWERGNIDEVFRTVSDREIKFRNQAEELSSENEALRAKLAAIKSSEVKK